MAGVFIQADTKHVSDPEGIKSSNENLADRLPVGASDSTLFGLATARDIYTDGYPSSDMYERINNVAEEMRIPPGHEFNFTDSQQYHQAMVGTSAYSHGISVEQAKTLYGERLGEYAGLETKQNGLDQETISLNGQKPLNPADDDAPRTAPPAPM